MWLPQFPSDAPNAFAIATWSMSTTTGNSRYNCAKTSAAIWLNSSMFGVVSAIVPKLYKRARRIIEDVQPLEDCSPLVAAYPVGRCYDDVVEIVAVHEIELASRRVDEEPAPAIIWLELFRIAFAIPRRATRPGPHRHLRFAGRWSRPPPSQTMPVAFNSSISRLRRCPPCLAMRCRPALCVRCGALYFDGLPAGWRGNSMFRRADRRPFEGVVVGEVRVR